MIKVELSFSNPAELVAFFTPKQIEHVVSVSPETQSSLFDSSQEVDVPVATPAASAPKRTRKAKSSDASEAPKGVVSAQPEVAINTGNSGVVASGVPCDTDAVVEPEVQKDMESQVAAPQTDVSAEYSEDDIRKELGIYNGAHGMDEARALLAQFNANRISEVKKEDYARFIETARNRP